MQKETKDQLGPKRLALLKKRFGSQAVLDDELTLACLAAERREMSDRQRPIFAAIHLQRRAGVRPSAEDLSAWEAAACNAPDVADDAAPSSETPKPKPRKQR